MAEDENDPNNETPTTGDDENGSWNVTLGEPEDGEGDPNDPPPPPPRFPLPPHITFRGFRNQNRPHETPQEPSLTDVMKAIHGLTTGLATTQRKLHAMEETLKEEYTLPYQEHSLATKALIDPGTYGTPFRKLQTAKKQRVKLSELRQHPLTDLDEDDIKGLDPAKVLNFNKVRQPKPKFSEEDAYNIAQGIAIRQSNKFDHGCTLHEDDKTKAYPPETTINGDAVTDPDAIVVGDVVVKLLDAPNTQPACEAKRFPFADRANYDADQLWPLSPSFSESLRGGDLIL